MSGLKHPAVKAFTALVGKEPQVFAQVLIARVEDGYDLRHMADEKTAVATLRVVNLTELRALVQFTQRGAFRPLKSAPNLTSGWRYAARTDAELADALNAIYPGALVDWHAAQSPAPPVTDYRPFTERQTGMYRIATFLNDAQAAQVARACCHRDFCLKQRLWTVPGLALDAATEKSLIPCLEPCALLLEFARKAMRLEQDEPTKLPTGATELRALRERLEAAQRQSHPELREADFNAPENPRRIRLELEKISDFSALAVAAKAT